MSTLKNLGQMCSILSLNSSTAILGLIVLRMMPIFDRITRLVLDTWLKKDFYVSFCLFVCLSLPMLLVPMFWHLVSAVKSEYCSFIKYMILYIA